MSLVYMNHVLDILSDSRDLRRTALGIARQTGYAAGGAAVGGVVGGPAGALVGTVVGAVVGYIRADPYDSLIDAVRQLSDRDKVILGAKVQQLSLIDAVRQLSDRDKVILGAKVQQLVGAMSIDEFSLIDAVRQLSDRDKVILGAKVQQLVGAMSIDEFVRWIQTEGHRQLLLTLLQQAVTSTQLLRAFKFPQLQLHFSAINMTDIPHDERRDDEPKNGILDELPPDLLRLALFIAKAFYGREHYVVMDYIQKNTCIKEDDLRVITKFDQRFLRGIIVQLKVDKILKERIVSEEADGRCRKVNYYYINYRALLNVAKYKIDHMRQRLEVKDKDEVYKASYKCSGCQHHYDAMEMDKIFDPMMQEMRCWRCQGLVEPDETAGPTDETRSSLARFNDQMAPLFAMIQNLDGIRLAPHILEPPIKTVDNIPSEAGLEKKVLQVGERAFSGHTAATRSTMYQNGITVSIEGESAAPKVEEKKAVPWLQNQMHSPTPTPVDDQMQKAFADLVDNPAALVEEELPEAAPVHSDVERLLMDEFDQEEAQLVGEPEPKRPKLEADTSPESTTDEEEMISVGGRRYYLDEVTPDLVRQMTEAEKEVYIRITRENFDFY
ncbi:General transcription factor IIE subunit 1 [Toxocara canis]|uniref:General transcription factor IIE subunit 1 n=1 Tax=Toxocara canis TaxID=6265 RepID=A0A0B2USA1_TOXCA|nr:General transcription factor IIE subunit 1 [Toxocara canis]